MNFHLLDSVRVKWFSVAPRGLGTAQCHKGRQECAAVLARDTGVAVKGSKRHQRRDSHVVPGVSVPIDQCKTEL